MRDITVRKPPSLSRQILNSTGMCLQYSEGSRMNHDPSAAPSALYRSSYMLAISCRKMAGGRDGAGPGPDFTVHLAPVKNLVPKSQY